jgi:hypothetical protein
MAAKVCLGAPKYRDCVMRPLHQLAVPEESKHEHETKRCNECDEEFFPVHNFFLLRFLLNPIKPGSFIAKRRIVVDSNLF